ncbi:MAG: flagellar basal body P-ring formation protein FlgA [Succinivibrio sp.]|nr:flagellar basal body P-ring formation protein FlgA [Succinivibrio sp.]
MKHAGYVVTVLSTFFFSNFFNAVNASMEEAAFLRHVAEQYILAQFPDQGRDYQVEVTAAKLDPNRNYGGKCEGYLTAQLQGSDIKTSSSVKITCTKPGNNFSIIVPVKIKMKRPAFVAATGIPHGSVITDAMIKEVWLSETENQSGAINLRESLVGSKVRKDIRAGEQIRPSSLCMICKGDSISLEARKGGLSLKTQGVALSDGNYGEEIQVRNSKSKKVIQATVRAVGVAEVAF